MNAQIEHARHMRDWWQKKLNQLEASDPMRNRLPDLTSQEELDERPWSPWPVIIVMTCVVLTTIFIAHLVWVNFII